MEILVNSLGDYGPLIETLFKEAGERVWLFSGELGAGKTTLIQKILTHLQTEDEVTSPTFSLVNEYEYPEGKVYHMDLYRINDLDEAINIGLEEYLYSGSYCFIEWPEIAGPIFDDDCFKIRFEILDITKRKINLQ